MKKGEEMKILLSIVLAAIFMFMLISIIFAQECFTNHDCPDVNMNCVHRKCQQSMYPSQNNKESTSNDKINELIDERAREIERNEPHDYLDTNTGRMLHCVGGVCN
jgi:hypothetical protein